MRTKVRKKKFFKLIPNSFTVDLVGEAELAVFANVQKIFKISAVVKE